MVLIFALKVKPTSLNTAKGKQQADRLLILTANRRDTPLKTQTGCSNACLSFSVLMPLLFDPAKNARMLHGIYPNGNILSEFGRIKTKTDLKKIPFAIILHKCCLILSGCKICFDNISPGNEKCSKKFLIITVRCRFF